MWTFFPPSSFSGGPFFRGRFFLVDLFSVGHFSVDVFSVDVISVDLFSYNRNINYISFFIYTPFLSNAPTGQTAHHIFTLNGSNDADSRKGVPFWLWLIL